MPRALLSVTDKSGIEDFARKLADAGFELLSTGGTARALRNAQLSVIDVAEVTGFPEMLGGRVKTLHPMIHGGILGDPADPGHVNQMKGVGIQPIQIVAVNLYAFEKTVTGEHSASEAIESIDIGGPAMIRAAAKNHASVAVVVDPADYDRVAGAAVSGDWGDLRRELAAKAYRHTAFYDSMISRYLSAQYDDLPETLTLGYRRVLGMRYGENPHQSAALYADPLAAPGIAQASQIWGKELSYNNVLDADAAWGLVCDLGQGACAIIKHGNPCGAARADSLGEAYTLAKSSDPISAFGGIAAFAGAVDGAAAQAMTAPNNFLEVVIAESFDEQARAIFKDRSGWGQNVRLLEVKPVTPSGFTVRTISGGALIQQADFDPGDKWTFVTQRQPSESELAAMKTAWTIVAHVKSNGIVLATADALRGIGAGQMNRVQSVRLAIEQAGEHAPNCALASDAFFPFPDSIETLAGAGVRAVVQPGGSKKDPDVIQRADELGIAMAFTGVRHFRH